MKRKLYLKILSGYLLFVILTFITLCTFTQHLTVRYLTRQKAQELNRECTLIAAGNLPSHYQDPLSLDALQQQLSYISSYLSAQIWVTDDQGNLLLDSSDSSIGEKAQSGTRTPIPGFNIADFGDSYYMTGDFYSLFSDETLTVFSPITRDYRVQGYVLIHIPCEQVTAESNEFMNIGFYTVGILFLYAFLILTFFTYTLYKPMRKIISTASSYSDGNFEKRIDIHSDDEIGFLADTMNYLAAELDTREEDQRKFISNVSHDFRSPLTSIKGYIEAMLDGTIPPEQQEKYLNIILFETERLNKLTESLLDLNRFGRHGIMLDITDFDINHTIRTTIMTFEGTCKKKGLSFDLVLTSRELFVRGDTSKIQRILYNLIDNAVKFSYPETSVKIETSIKNEKVLISVKDSGIGIPGESLKKIWNRFYKTDLSRGKDKRGIGLGLSIVKEIIEAHGEHINVISTEGVGTEFIFTLPLSRRVK